MPQLREREMEAGWLTAGGRPILWTTEQRSFTAIPAGEDVLLQPAAIFTRKNRTAAHLCRNCKIVMALYQS